MLWSYGKYILINYFFQKLNYLIKINLFSKYFMDNINFDQIFQSNTNYKEIRKHIYKELINCELCKLSIFEINYKNYIESFSNKKYTYPEEIKNNIGYYDYIKKERQIIFSNASKLFKEFLNIDKVLLESKIYLSTVSEGVNVLDDFLGSKFYKEIETFKNNPQDNFIKIKSVYISEILSVINELLRIISMIINIQNKEICITLINFYLYILKKYYSSLKNDQYIDYILNLNLTFSPPQEKDYIDTLILYLQRLNIIKKETKELIN